MYIPLPFNTGMELWRSLQHHLQHSKETRNTLILRALCGTEPRKTTAPKKRKNSSPCAKEPEHMCMSSKMECAKGAGNKLWVSYSAFSLLYLRPALVLLYIFTRFFFLSFFFFALLPPNGHNVCLNSNGSNFVPLIYRSQTEIIQ